MDDSTPPADKRWDDPGWAEREPSWTAGCRWLQSQWRESELNLPPGPHSPSTPDRLVASTLPAEVGWDSNFLSPEAAQTARALPKTAARGIVDTDRLRRNLLSSQPLVINLFGHLQHHPHVLMDWLRNDLGFDVEQIDAVHFEWGPERAEDPFGGNAAFDAAIECFDTGGQRCLLAVEAKYAESGAKNLDVREVYRRHTRDSGLWAHGADWRLDSPGELAQLWINACYTQVMPRFSRAQMLLMSAAADHDAVELLATVAAEQAPEAPGWVDWSPYEALLQRATANVETAEWASRFRRRYLDFSPVAHLLAGDDPRVTGERRQPIGDPFCLAQLDEALTQLRSIGGRVLGFHEVASGSILNQVESALSGQRLDQARLVDLALMTRRVRDAAEALRITRADASSVWSAIETPPHA